MTIFYQVKNGVDGDLASASIGQSGCTDTSGSVEVGSSCALGSGGESTFTCVVLRAKVVNKEHSITLVTSWVWELFDEIYSLFYSHTLE